MGKADSLGLGLKLYMCSMSQMHTLLFKVCHAHAQTNLVHLFSVLTKSRERPLKAKGEKREGLMIFDLNLFHTTWRKYRSKNDHKIY